MLARVLRILCDFSSARWAPWTAIDDRVMGGVSQSTLEPLPGLAVFHGTLSREQNGGFASVRSPQAELACPGCQALVLRVRGDGRRYELRLRTAQLEQDGFDGPTYAALFETHRGSWEELELPLPAFRARLRGRELPDAAPLDPAQLATLGLMVSDGPAGPFRLELAWIAARVSPADS